MKNNLVVLVVSAFIAIVISFLLVNVVKIGIPAAIGLAFVIFLIPLIWSKSEFGLGLIAFFLAFERIPAVDIAGMTLKINHVLILLVSFIFIVKSLAKGSLYLPKDPIRFMIALFVASLMLSLPQAVNLPRGLQVLAFMMLMALVYLITTLIVDGKKALISVLGGLMIGAIVQVLIGFFQFTGDAAGLPISVTLLKPGYDKVTFGFARVQGTAAEPLYFADYLFIPLFLSISLLLRGEARKVLPVWLMYALAAGAAINFILAVSRGAYIGLALGFMTLIVSQAKLILRSKTILASFFIIIMVAFGSFLGLLKSEPRAIEEFLGHVAVNDVEIGESVVSRVSASSQALELFKTKPLFGAGLGNFGPITQGDPSEIPEGGWFIVNNEYLELLAENGLVGLIGFLTLVILIIFRAQKAIKHTDDQFLKAVLVGLVLALVGILGQYLTFSTLYIIHIWFLLGLISAVTLIIFKTKQAA